MTVAAAASVGYECVSDACVGHSARNAYCRATSAAAAASRAVSSVAHRVAGTVSRQGSSHTERGVTQQAPVNANQRWRRANMNTSHTVWVGLYNGALRVPVTTRLCVTLSNPTG